MNGINPRQMKQMMRKMGIQQTEVDAQTVIIRCADRDIVIEHPEVVRVNMMGADTWQISGHATEQSRAQAAPEISEEDIAAVMAQAGCSKADAEAALGAAGGDLARAILDLQEKSR